MAPGEDRAMHDVSGIPVSSGAAPELKAAMAETRQIRRQLRALAAQWRAVMVGPHAHRLSLEERAMLTRHAEQLEELLDPGTTEK